MTKISFKSHHGTPYEKFLIFRVHQNGKIRRIGKMLAPNLELATAKSRELWTNEPADCSIQVMTPAQAQAQYRASLKKKK